MAIAWEPGRHAGSNSPEMIDLLRDLSDWVVGFADSDWSVLILAVNAFTESIFFPIPPDPLLIGISLRQPEIALLLAAIATASSVAGAMVGYWLGHRLGRPFLYRLVARKRVDAAEAVFKKYGGWAVLMAAFTPIPYKVFAISAGILGLNMRTFVIASLIGRGARFFMLGGLLLAFGEDIEEFIDSNFEMLTLAIGGALVVALGIIVIIVWRRRVRGVAG